MTRRGARAVQLAASQLDSSSVFSSRFASHVRRRVSSSTRLPPAGVSSSTGNSKGKSTDLAGLLLFGGLVVGTGCLGVWQSERYFWKIDAIQERNECLAKQLEPLPDFPEAYRRYLVSGTFLHGLELSVGPRAAPPSVHGPAQGLGTNPQGFYILTPFRAGDGYVV
ncbi:surfeit locus 1, partial [Nannochloropsis gaditana CCMP526]|uniref:surfeit locus 1 n=1 Tax=Nannochloropsis gaditana (strain CCMP526) TaxID=1093141 RepID=UPI00029F628C